METKECFQLILERIKEDEEASVSVRNTSKNATRFFITLANKICTPYMHLTVRRMGNFFYILWRLQIRLDGQEWNTFWRRLNDFSNDMWSEALLTTRWIIQGSMYSVIPYNYVSKIDFVVVLLTIYLYNTDINVRLTIWMVLELIL